MKLPKRFDHCDRRVSWKEALAGIASPVFRLHRYRNAHNRLLQGALRDLDCADARSCKR